MTKADEQIKKYGITKCYWCQRPFNSRRKATHDHVHAVRGGKRAGYEKVFACNACNWCRGDMLFEEYQTLVDAEHLRSRLEGRKYDPPKAPDRRAKRPPITSALHYELGKRAVGHLRLENNQSPSQARKFIIRMTRAAHYASIRREHAIQRNQYDNCNPHN